MQQAPNKAGESCQGHVIATDMQMSKMAKPCGVTGNRSMSGSFVDVTRAI